MTILKPCLKDYPTKGDFKCLWVNKIFENRYKYMLYKSFVVLLFCNFNKEYKKIMCLVHVYSFILYFSSSLYHHLYVYFWLNEIYIYKLYIPMLSLCKKKINIDYFCHLCWKCTFLSPFDKHILRVTILIQYNIFGLKYCNQWSSIFDMYVWYLLLTL